MCSQITCYFIAALFDRWEAVTNGTCGLCALYAQSGTKFHKIENAITNWNTLKWRTKWLIKMPASVRWSAHMHQSQEIPHSTKIVSHFSTAYTYSICTQSAIHAVAVTHHATPPRLIETKKTLHFITLLSRGRPKMHAYQRTCRPITKYMSENEKRFKTKGDEETNKWKEMPNKITDSWMWT